MMLMVVLTASFVMLAFGVVLLMLCLMRVYRDNLPTEEDPRGK